MIIRRTVSRDGSIRFNGHMYRHPKLVAMAGKPISVEETCTPVELLCFDDTLSASGKIIDTTVLCMARCGDWDD